MPGAIEVASLYATLRLEDQLTGALESAGRGIDGIGQRMGRVGGQISGFGGAIQAAIAPLVGFGAQGIRTAMSFESAMAEISARTGLLGDDMQRIEDYALRMGEQTAFSAQDAANAFLQLLSSGQSAEEAIATLPAVLDAAAASGGDLGTTADAITDILNMFNLSALDAGTAADSLARASGASSATMSDLIAGFQNVGGIAATFGMDVNDVAAALAVLSENGIKSAEAGTALKRMLMNFGNEVAIGAFEELGVSLYDAQGNIRDMNTVLGELGDALAGLPDQDVNRLVDALGGIGGSPALLALRDGFSGMEEDMAGAAGASDVAAARLDTFEGAMETLAGSIETLQIEALTPFIENTLQPLVEGLTDVVNNVTAWAEENPELANTISTVVFGLTLFAGILVPLGVLISAGGTVVTGVMALAGGLTAVAGAAGGIAVPMLAAIGPILAVGAAIAGVIAQINQFNALMNSGGAAVAEVAVANNIGTEELWQAHVAAARAELEGTGWGPLHETMVDALARVTFNATLAAMPEGRAAGGPVSAGMPYLVGEVGPELFVPGRSGGIVPNDALGGGVVVNVTAYGSSPREFADLVMTALRDRGL